MRPASATSQSQTLQDMILGLENGGADPALGLRTDYRTFVWTYAELARRARATAAFLAAQGVRRGDRLVLWAPNSPTWAATFLACLAAGVVAVPLDLHSTPDFVERVAAETKARLLLRGPHQLTPGVSGPVLSDDQIAWETRPGAPENHDWPELGPDDWAEIVYTSGTTALPRGVILTQRNLAANLAGTQPIVPSEPFYRFVSLLPLSHAFEQMVGLLLPLTRGGSVIYVASLKPSAVLDVLRTIRPNVLVLVPRLLELLRQRVLAGLPESLRPWIAANHLAAEAWPQSVRRAVFWMVLRQFGGYLRYLVLGGAPLDRDLERFWDRLGVLVLQGYGLTEAAPVVTANTPTAYRIGSVGKPLFNVRVRLASDGEVLVHGPNVMPGYYQRADATAAAFVDENGERWLRTEDVGTFDPDGFLFLHGRKKDVIVTSAGLKVYPEDVETILNRQPGVQDSCVFEREDGVHAVLLLDPRTRPAPAAAVAAANLVLNPVQRIQGFSVWPGADFPRTPTQKVQKYQVRAALGRGIPGPPSLRQPPSSPVARIVAELAPSREVRPEATLGDSLGLSSIDRLELVTRLEEAFNRDLPEDRITGETTLAQLEGIVGESPSRQAFRPRRWLLSPPIRAVREEAQRRLIFPVLRRILWLRVVGQENLREMSGPFILAGNHLSLLDGPAVLLALPEPLRRDVAIAALAGFYDPLATNRLIRAMQWVMFDLVAVFFNVYPVPRESGFRESLRYSGWLVDRGWKLVILPEGTRSWTGQMGPFRAGIGVLVSELKVPVVPFRIHGTLAVLARGAAIPKPGPVTITFGKPLRFPPASYGQITREIEHAVARLAPPNGRSPTA